MKVYLHGLDSKDIKKINEIVVQWDRFYIKPNGLQGSYFIIPDTNNENEFEKYNTNISKQKTYLSNDFINDFVKNKIEDFIIHLPNLYRYGCINSIIMIDKEYDNYTFDTYTGWNKKGYTVKTKSNCFINESNFNEKNIENLIKNLDYNINKNNLFKIGKFIINLTNDKYNIYEKIYNDKEISINLLETLNRSDIRMFFKEIISSTILGEKQTPLWNINQVANITSIKNNINFPFRIPLDKLFNSLCLFNKKISSTKEITDELIIVQLKEIIKKYTDIIDFDIFKELGENIILQILSRQYDLDNKSNIIIPDEFYNENIRCKIDWLHNIFLISYSISSGIVNIIEECNIINSDCENIINDLLIDKEVNINDPIIKIISIDNIKYIKYCEFIEIHFDDNTKLTFNIDKIEENTLIGKDICYTNLSNESIDFDLLFSDKKVIEVTGEAYKNDINMFQNIMFQNIHINYLNDELNFDLYSLSNKSNNIIFHDDEIYHNDKILEDVKIIIFQLKNQYQYLKYKDYFDLTIFDKKDINIEKYEKIIGIKFKKINDINKILNELFIISNLDPNKLNNYFLQDTDLKEYNLSVGDVINIKYDNVSIDYFINKFGFYKLEKFDYINNYDEKIKIFKKLYETSPVIAVSFLSKSKFKMINIKIISLIDTICLPLPDKEIDINNYLDEGNYIANKIIDLKEHIVFQVCKSYCNNLEDRKVYTIEQINNSIKLIGNKIILNTFIFCNNEVYNIPLIYHDYYKANDIKQFLVNKIEKDFIDLEYHKSLKNISDSESVYIKNMINKMNIIYKLLND